MRCGGGRGSVGADAVCGPGRGGHAAPLGGAGRKAGRPGRRGRGEAGCRGGAERKPGHEEESFLHWVVRCSGFIGLVILLLSIYFVSTVGRLFWEMRVEVAAPPEIVAAVREPAGAARFQGNLQSRAGGRFVLQPPVDHRHYRIAQRFGRGPRGDGAGGRGDHGRDGEEDQHVGRARHAGADDRSVGHAEGDDRQLRRDCPVRRAAWTRLRWPPGFPRRCC